MEQADVLTRAEIDGWLQLYRSALMARDAGALADLFTQDAQMQPSAFEPALVGAVALRRYFDIGVVASQRDIAFTAELVAIEGAEAMIVWRSEAHVLPVNGVMETAGASRIGFARVEGRLRARRMEHWLERRVF